MTVVRCVSSQLMTGLLTWRNPQGSEENWILRPQGIQNRWRHIDKVLSTEVGLGLLIITSAVETIAYSALTLTSLLLHPATDRPCKFFAQLLESSSFTIIWALADVILYNPLVINVMTQESFARYCASMFNPTRILMFRLADRIYVANWEQQHRNGNAVDGLLGPILREGRATQELVDQGANLIQQDVLANASPETIRLFREMNPHIYMFVLTKAVYIYTFGTKKDNEIPNFFKPETQDLILALRQENYNEETEKELKRLITDQIQFESSPQRESAQAIFNGLRGAASKELQGSLLTTLCWEKAANIDIL